jgi:hypothetical protein
MPGAFTYTGNPSESNIDAVRLEIGDVSPNQFELGDEEIQYALTKEGTVSKAAARCCEMLAAKYSKKDSMRAGSVQADKQNISLKYRSMAKIFRARGTRATSFVMPAASLSDKSDNELAVDQPQPSFKRGIHSNPDVSQQSDDSDIDLRVTGNT